MIKKSKYLIGIDGGGTKTAFCACDVVSKEKMYFTFGSSNYKASSLLTAKENLLGGFKEVCKALQVEVDQIVGVVAGLSGYDTEEDQRVYQNMMHDLEIPREKIYLCIDAEIAFFSVGEIPGVVVISGTGSIAYGLGRHQKIYRAGGWGEVISDLGSGSWIGAYALRQMIKYCDGYGEYKSYYQKITEYCGVVHFKEVPTVVTTYNNAQIAPIAKIIVDKAEEGDMDAIALLKVGVQHLVEMCQAVYRIADFKEESCLDMVMAGSLFKSQVFRGLFIHSFKEVITQKSIRFLQASENPVDGAIAIGFNRFL